MARGKQRVSSVTPVQAPVGGIDDTSAISNMDPRYALAMVNWYPQASALRVRDGYREHVTGLVDGDGDPVIGKTLMSYIPASGPPKLFCATDVGIYDVTASGTRVFGDIVHPLTNGRVVWTQFSNIAGTWLIGCNGTDPAFLYNGSTWVDFANSGSPTNPGEINGSLSPSGISYVHQHKNRLWFLESGTMSAWYMPLNAVAGTVTEFPMGGIFTQGGELYTLFSWTMDAGYSVDDIFVIQSSRGEIAGYGGTDPSNAGTWWLEARYYIGAPLSRRGVCPLNGDMLLLTEFGIVPISKVVGGQYQLGSTDATASGRISTSLNSLVRQRSGDLSWEISNSPFNQSIFLSVPESGGYMPFQYVMNSLTGSWTNYDLPAYTIKDHMGVVFFTDYAGVVHRYGDTTVDGVLLDGTGGTPIIAAFQQAYDYFGDPTTNKHYKLIKSIFESSSKPSYLTTISPDYEPGGLSLLGIPGITNATASQWDVAKWDEAVWSPGLLAWQEWVGVVGTGYSASLILKTRTTVDTRYAATHWVFERGISL